MNVSSRGGSRTVIVIYQSAKQVYKSATYPMMNTPDWNMLTIRLIPFLKLKGDICLRVYNKRANGRSKKLMFACQFNTAWIQGKRNLSFDQQDLDFIRNIGINDNCKVFLRLKFVKGESIVEIVGHFETRLLERLILL
ncbi:hypothetical protein ACOME3_005938 [Neoechinorhynchus agilis]